VPLYEFECKKCHHRFEKIQSVSAPDPKCEKCGDEVERLLHAPDRPISRQWLVCNRLREIRPR